jgi:hypothetical protein
LRFAFAYTAKTIDIKYLPILGYISLVPAIGFAYIYLTDSRKTGPEVFGNKIWWNNLRPIHALLYALFAYMAITQKREAWIVLLADVFFGLGGFIAYHSN